MDLNWSNGSFLGLQPVSSPCSFILSSFNYDLNQFPKVNLFLSLYVSNWCCVSLENSTTDFGSVTWAAAVTNIKKIWKWLWTWVMVAGWMSFEVHAKKAYTALKKLLLEIWWDVGEISEMRNILLESGGKGIIAIKCKNLANWCSIVL